MASIKNSYLMWIGSADYSTVDDWVDEATEMGVSKRLPSITAGKAMLERGTVIFVAHDEGEHVTCEHCQGEVECPDCRKRSEQIANIQSEVAKLRAPFIDFDSEAPAGKKRSVKLREDKITQINDAIADCAECAGEGTYTTGTGGHVVLNDGSVWDYRRYMYWRNQPKKWDYTTEVAETHMCEECGGFGHLPAGCVFGCFIPDRVEYILTGEETEEVRAEMGKVHLVTRTQLSTEQKRKCGYRHPGGTYVVTTKRGAPKTAEKVVADLVEAGIITPKGAEIQGSFIKFTNPVEIDEKRFRGIKRWHLSAALEVEADIAIDDED